MFRGLVKRSIVTIIYKDTFRYMLLPLYRWCLMSLSSKLFWIQIHFRLTTLLLSSEILIRISSTLFFTSEFSFHVISKNYFFLWLSNEAFQFRKAPWWQSTLIDIQVFQSQRKWTRKMVSLIVLWKKSNLRYSILACLNFYYGKRLLDPRGTCHFTLTVAVSR